MTLYPLLNTPMLNIMALKPTTTTVRVYPETRAEIGRLAEAEGKTAAEYLRVLVARAGGKAMLAQANEWYAAHPGEAARESERWAGTLMDGLENDPYPLDAHDSPPRASR